ncbi:MAG: MBOAT family O-acyltransferase, partial [Eubacteriales bacterium]|nr:MBOAT family O-acyltransferase [Eubacteriales bacterium]
LALGVLCNLGIFFYFKYYDFFIENINALFRTDFNLRHILLPLGISFFTFQQLSFIIDRALGRAHHYSLVNYAMFVTFFPQLIAGPIVLYDEMMPQFENPDNRRFRAESFARGVLLFTLGLAKKVLLADLLALPANYGFESTYYLDTGAVILTLLSYTFELYFDFSGYCDMAMGLGKMFNIELPENFNSPYRACTVKELWNRWHMTLTRFFTHYVYIPLGGSRRSAPRVMLNIMIVFALSGLWHGANWTFVAWGVMQGALVVWDSLGLVAVSPAPGEKPMKTLRSMAGKAPLLTVPRAVGGVCTFTAFVLSLIFFRSESLTYAFEMFRRLCIPLWPGWILRTAQTVDLSEFYLLTKGVEEIAPAAAPYVFLALWIALLLLSAYLIFFRKKALTLAEQLPLTPRLALLTALLFTWCVISLSQVSTFLYFNF